MTTLRQRIRSNNKAPAKRTPLLKQDPNEPKSGCLWCPLMPFAHDFDRFADSYNRDAKKIVVNEKEGHKVKSRFIRQPYAEVDILCVGEAPGANEDNKGEAFVGKSGKRLKGAIEALCEVCDIDEDRVAYTNVVRCRPPRNKTPGKTIVKCCGYELVREIAERKPKLVIALGGVSLEFLTGHTGITTIHGRILKCSRPEFPKLDILACLHPSYIDRFDHLDGIFLDAIGLAGEYVSGEYTPLPGEGEYHVLDDPDDVIAVLKAMREDKDIVAFDTETGSLSPFDTDHPQLLCFSFSNEEGVGYTVPYDHTDSPWSKDKGRSVQKARAKVRTALRNFFADDDVPKIAQHEKYDRKHIRHALGIEPTNVVRDTMTTHLVLDERKGTHDLKTLAHIYTGMGGYEKPLDDYTDKHKAANVKKGGSYARIPGEILFIYAAMDADVTLRVDRHLREEEEYKANKKLRRLAEHFLPALSEVLSDIEYTGAMVDPKVVDFLYEKYTNEMDEHSAAIKKLPKVRKLVSTWVKQGKKPPDFEFNPGSPQQLRPVLFDYYGETPTELTDDGFKRAVERHKKANQKSNMRVSFTSIIKDAVKKKHWDLFSTKADVLYEYERRGNDLAPLILSYRAADTLRGTFVTPLKDLLDEHGRVHGDFNIFGTVTGRLSSSHPNLQNIPNKDDGIIKQVYVSRFGDHGVIFQIDYSQIELRVAASWFNDPVMIKAYRAGIDLHSLTGHDIAISSGLTEKQYRALNDADKKAWRVRAKRTNFGTIYGIGAVGLQSTLRKEGVFVTVDECRELIELFFKARPVLKRGIEKLEQQVERDGFLESFTGRLRRVPEVASEDNELVARALRQSVNFPIQSGAADMTLMAMVLIWREMRARGMKSKIILTVHDSIVYDCHVDEVLEVAELSKHIMENLPKLSDEVLPGIDWSWLKVPIVADCEMGVTWGQMVGFDPCEVIEEDVPDEPLFYKEEGKQKYRKPHSIDELWELIAHKAAA